LSGRERIEPGPGEESVWDYPRPPRVEESPKRVRVLFGGATIAETTSAKRVLETSHPPVYYIPPEDVRMAYLERTSHSTFCEWKGQAGYYDLRVGDRSVSRAAWFYAHPSPGFESIRDHLAFYPSKMDACYVDGELVRSHEGDFYGGWITIEIVGPFKGGPGTWGW
jgi:uncharacterized protein (DUF427 family)